MRKKLEVLQVVHIEWGSNSYCQWRE